MSALGLVNPASSIMLPEVICESGHCRLCCLDGVQLLCLCGSANLDSPSRGYCCASGFCRACWTNVVSASFERTATYALGFSPVKCPGCNLHLASNSWLSVCGPEVRQAFIGAARSMLTVPCCGDVSLLWEEEAVDLVALEEDVFRDFDARAKECVHSAWTRYSSHKCRADDFLDTLLQSMPGRDDAQAARRSAEGKAPLDLMELLTPHRLPALIVDLERRASLQLAYRRRFPMIRSPCCGSEICFACKSHEWHDRGACQQLRRGQAGQRAQFCPECGVPTERNGGCPHIACVCGVHWTWMSLASALSTGDMELILKHLEIEAVTGFLNDYDSGGTVLAVAVAMSKPNIDIVRMILDKGGDAREHGILQHAVSWASRAELDFKAAQMREDIAFLLISRGASGRVCRKYRKTCPKRLAAWLDFHRNWLPGGCEDDMAEEEHPFRQQRLDRDLALCTSRLREGVKLARKKDKEMLMRHLRHFKGLSKRGGRHKAGESRLEAIA